MLGTGAANASAGGSLEIAAATSGGILETGTPRPLHAFAGYQFHGSHFACHTAGQAAVVFRTIGIRQQWNLASTGNYQ